MGCGDETANCGTELSSLPTLTGCPGDSEKLLVMGAEGGKGHGKYALREWSDIKGCILSDSYKVCKASITTQGTTYQNDELIGASELEFILVNKQVFTQEDGDFAFNNSSGTIAFLTITVFVGDKLVAPYKSS